MLFSPNSVKRFHCQEKGSPLPSAGLTHSQARAVMALPLDWDSPPKRNLAGERLLLLSLLRVYIWSTSLPCSSWFLYLFFDNFSPVVNAWLSSKSENAAGTWMRVLTRFMVRLLKMRKQDIDRVTDINYESLCPRFIFFFCSFKVLHLHLLCCNSWGN